MDRIDKIKDMLLDTPDDCFLLHALGLEYLKLNDNEKAIQCFEKLIAINRDYVGTYYHLAKTYERINSIEQAIDTYNQGISIATKLKDMHARNELQMALDDVLDE